MSDNNSNEERENADGSKPPTPNPAPNEFQHAEPEKPKRFQFLTGKFNPTSEIPKRMKDQHRREREKSNRVRKSCAYQHQAHDTIDPMGKYNSENIYHEDDMSSSFNNSGMQFQGSNSRWNPPRNNDYNSTANNHVSVRRVDERPYERTSSIPPPPRIYGGFARPYNLPRPFNQNREVVDAASAGTQNHVNPQNEFGDSPPTQEPIHPPLNRLASPIPALSLNMHHLPIPPVVPIEDEYPKNEYPNDAISHYSSEINLYPNREAFVNSQGDLQLFEDDEDLERPFETNGNDNNDNHQRLSNAGFRALVQEPEYYHHSVNRYDENWQRERGSQRDFPRDEGHVYLHPLERNHNDFNVNHRQSSNSGFETNDNIQVRDVHEQQQPQRHHGSGFQWPENRFGRNDSQRIVQPNANDNHQEPTNAGHQPLAIHEQQQPRQHRWPENRLGQNDSQPIVQPNANDNHQEPTNAGQPLANDAFEQQRESPPWKIAVEKWLKKSQPYWHLH